MQKILVTFLILSAALCVSFAEGSQDLEDAVMDSILDANLNDQTSDAEEQQLQANTKSCNKDTGGTCNWAAGCYSWRKAVCSNNKCVCGSGKCATANDFNTGKCVETLSPTAHPTATPTAHPT